MPEFDVRRSGPIRGDCERARTGMPRVIALSAYTLLCAVVLALPAILLFASDVSLIAITNESLAYRFFFSLRLLSGSDDVVFLPQGQALTALQQLFHLLFGTIPAGPDGLRAALDRFGYLTLGANLLLLAGSFLLLFASSSTKCDRLLVLACGLFATYGSRSGINAAMTPDYYVFESSLTILSLSLAFAILRKPSRMHTDGAALTMGLGVLAGVMAAVKISLAATAVLPLLAIIENTRPSAGHLLVMVIRSGLVAAVIFGIIVLASYGFHLPALIDSAPRWLAFIANPGSEPAFWSSVFFWRQDGNAGASYAYALMVFPLASLIVLLRLSRRPADRNLLPLVLLLFLAAHLYSLIHRPAGTTLWEITIFAAAASAFAAASFQDRWRTGAHVLLILLLVSQATVSATINLPKLMDIPAFQTASNRVWAAHEKLMSSGDRAVFLVPDNNYTAGTVAEALLKGSSDMPTWNITTGRRLLQTLAPGLEIVQTLGHLDPKSSVMWVDIPEQTSLATQFPVLAERLQTADCTQWRVQNWAWWPRIIIVCPRETSTH